MTTNFPGPHAAAAVAATTLIATHPSLSVKAMDVTDVAGLGPAALIQVEDAKTLRAWVHVLNATGHTTGASAYGTTDPGQSGLPDWMWWRLRFIDTIVDQAPVRLWTMETSSQPRALAALLAATAHSANATPHTAAGSTVRPPGDPVHHVHRSLDHETDHR